LVKGLAALISIAVLALAGGASGSGGDAPTACTVEISPGQSIQSALNVSNPGDTICVREGTYQGELVVSRSGTSTNPITLTGFPGEAKPVIRPVPGLSGAHNTVKIYTSDWFNLRGFIIEGAYSDNAGCNAFNVWVSQGGAANDVEITDNEIRGNTAGSGILTEASTARIKVLRNSFHDNVDTVDCSGAQAHGMYIQGTNHLVANNLVYDNVDPDGGFGIQAYPSGSGSVFTQNTVTDAPMSCFYLSYNARLTNNICAHNGGFVGGGGATGCVLSTNVRFQTGSNRPSKCSFSGDITGDPQFIDRTNNNYRIDINSSAKDVADPNYSHSPDLAGNMRDSFPDVGAFEYIYPTPDPPPPPAANLCADGLDNDSDGYFDTEDSGCLTEE
jgi:hypothetical protein